MLPSSDDPALSEDHLRGAGENYYEQAKELVEGGVDLLLVETAQDILEVKAAIAGFERLFARARAPRAIQAQVTLDTSGRMLLGTDIASAMTTLEALPRGRIGLNCSTGPEHMREPIRYLGEHAPRPISCIPNAGLPLNTGTGDAVYPLEPEPMAETLARVRARVRRADRRRLLRHDARALARDRRAACRRVRRERDGAERATGERTVARAACVVGDARHRRCTRIRRRCSIGERVNAQGSRKVKRLLLADDYEGIVEVAREQVEAGAHVLDVCVALTERARRGGADVEGREAAVDERRDADHDRLDRGRRHRGARWRRSPGARSSTRSTWRTAASASTACCRW